MTIPLGFLAERWGRRLVLRLNLVSRIFMLSWAIMVGYFDWAMPVNAIIVGPTLSVLGGECVFNSITYALASGLTDDHVLRATYFGYMSSISYVVALLGPALASATMSVLLWLPFWLGIALLLLAVPMIHMLPEPSSLTGDSSDEEQSAPLLSSPIIKAQDAQPSLLRSTAERFKTLQAIVTSHPRNFSLLLISFFLTSLASSDTKLLVQYISKRYNWTFAAAGYLLSGKAVVNFTLLTVVIPKFLQSRRVSRGSASTVESGDAANVRYANACLVVSIVGALSIAVAATIWLLVPSLLIYALGSALPIFTLSLLKSPAVSPPHGKDHGDAVNPETHIFSIVMLVKTVGSLVGAPTMAMLWVRGIGLGGLALGMPYFVSGACYMVAVGVFRGIQVDSDLPTQVRSSSSPRTRTSSQTRRI